MLSIVRLSMQVIISISAMLSKVRLSMQVMLRVQLFSVEFD